MQQWIFLVLKSFFQTVTCFAHERQLITPLWEMQLYHICCDITLHATNSSFALHLSLSLTCSLCSPLSQSHLSSLSLSLRFYLSPPSLSLSESITHSDSLCNMPSSKLNSTLLDLQPFPSSKWLTSVITLQPEWETQRRGREEGWQTETWHERRGNAGLIIHTYCSKKEREQRSERYRKRERGRQIDPNGEVFLVQ